MEWVLLTPESIRTLSLVILNLAITLYLAGIRDKAEATWWLAAFTGGMVVFYLMRFVEASVFPLEALGTLSRLRMAVEVLVVPVALGAFAQFAYRFLQHPFTREARVVLWLNVLFLAGSTVYTAYIIVGRRDIAPLYMLYSLTWLGFCLLAAVVLLRKSRRLRGGPPSGFSDGRSTERLRRAFHAFAGLSALFAAILLVVIFLVGLELLPGILWAVVVLPGVFLFFSGLVVVYVNHAPEPTSVQVKLVGLSLATMLCVLGMTAVLLFPPGELELDSGMVPPDGQAFLFEPRASGGYEVSMVTRQVDQARGRPLDMGVQGTAKIPLGFPFPFFGSRWDSVTVASHGVVVFGEKHAPPPGGYRPYRDFDDVLPKIAPLFGLIPMANQAHKYEPEVFIGRAPGRLLLTWRYPSVSEAPAAPGFRLALHESGAIHFGYDELSRLVSLDPMGFSGGIRGLSPGGAAPRLEPVVLSSHVPFVVPAGVGVIDDVGLRFRQYVHGKSVRLFGLLMGATLFILLLYPFVFRTGLLHPLQRLLDGVRRVQAGDRDVELPVRVRDEIGVLTEHFNEMTSSLRDAEIELRAYAGELEHRVAERTAALEAGKAQLEEQARRLRELDELKTRFFANISHEFRTPLTLLLGPLQDFLEGRIEAAGLARHAPLMHRNARRLLGLINQLLDLARLEAGSMSLRVRRTDVVGFLRDLVLSFAARAEREGLTLLFEAEEEVVEGYVDRDKLEKIVANLLSNAFKFTTAGGKVRLSVVSDEAEGEAAATITVEDTGQGIPAAELPYVFDRFHQVDGSSTLEREGSGIGLALVKELVEQHGGAIEATSKVGFGTTFTLRLPLGTAHLKAGDLIEEDTAEETERSEEHVAWPGPEEPDAAAYTAQADTEPEGGHGTHVAEVGPRPTFLMVEDNPDMRAFLRSRLETEYDIVEACDGSEGLEQARACQPDLVLADVMMPRMDGFALCRALKEDPALNHIPVVLLTARAAETSKLEGLERGADDYLTKPFSTDELLARVENLIVVRRTLRARFSREVVLGPSEIVVPSAEAAWLEEVRAVVEAHLGDTAFTVDWLADEVGLSKRQLQRKLKTLTSLSPSGFIRTMRLGRAAQLLEQQAGTIAEIAYAVGFKDAEYFSKLFRQVFGVLPSEYARTG